MIVGRVGICNGWHRVPNELRLDGEDSAVDDFQCRVGVERHDGGGTIAEAVEQHDGGGTIEEDGGLLQKSVCGVLRCRVGVDGVDGVERHDGGGGTIADDGLLE